MGTIKHAEKTKPTGPVKKIPSFTPTRLLDSVPAIKADAELALEILKVRVTEAAQDKGGSAKARTVLLGQDILAAGFAISSIKRRAEGLWKVFTELLKQYRDAGGSFETGRFDIQFPDSSASKPAWKDEAVRLAEEVAKLRKKPFVAEEFIATIQKKYPAKASCSAKIVESVVGSGAPAEDDDE